MTMCDDVQPQKHCTAHSEFKMYSPYTVRLGSVLRVLLGLKFSNNALQLPLSLALREVAHFVVLWSDFHQPTGRDGTQNVY